MSRAHWVNALMGGSERLPDSAGLRIPVDMALAFHSDAGVRDGDGIIGTLGIFFTRENKGKFQGGADRYRSRDLTDLVQTQIVEDIRRTCEPAWSRRGMWNRAYYEARVPGVPTMLLELLSHQNFADMRLGHDPRFKFLVSRAVYKGILRYVSSQYDLPYVVQPLPVEAFAAEFAAAHGVEFPDAYYYDDLVIYANHSSGDFLDVTLHDGTWEYSFGRDHTPVFDAPASGVTEDMLREELDKFGFSIPADAAFTLSPYGETSYRAVFSADLLPTEGGFLHGTLTCDLRTQGDGQSTLSQLENRITTLAPVREEPILSPAQALAALQSGKSFEGAWFAQSVQQIEVRSCTLDYLSDSKRFYQPVYRFELSLSGQASGITDAVDYVPALF